ncbi:MAG TPA: hypothetical protein VK154_04680, partial [Chitinophagales bacterium]|nr:hypothetical protein [Chitinophagales bacterium]
AIQYKQGKMYCHQLLTNVTALSSKDSACQPKFFRIVSLPNHHLVEVKYYGKWVAVDPNGSSPGLTFKAPNGSYFSTADLLNDTNRVVPDYSLVNVRGDVLYRPVPGDSSRYRRLFDNREVTATSFQPKPIRNITGEVILPPGGAMVFTYTNGLSIDTSTAEGKKYVSKLMSLQAKCSPVTPAYCDSFLNLIALREGISVTEAKDAIYAGKIVFYNGAPNFAPFYYEGADNFPFHPTLQLLVPAHSEPLVLGRDLRAPFLLLDSTFSLWSNKEIPSIDQDRIKYLHNGEIRAADATQSILTTINLNAINWLGGLTIDPLGEADKLVITRKRFKSKPGGAVTTSSTISAGVSNFIAPRIVKNK